MELRTSNTESENASMSDLAGDGDAEGGASATSFIDSILKNVDPAPAFDPFADANTPEGRALIGWAAENRWDFSFTVTALVEPKFPRSEPTIPVGGIKTPCPYFKDHKDEKEKGALTCIAIDSHHGNPFSVSCSDSACRCRPPLDFIAKWQKNGSITQLPDVNDPPHQRAIYFLHPKSPPRDIDVAAEVIEESDLDTRVREQAVLDMRNRLGKAFTPDVENETFKKARAKLGVGKTGKKSALQQAIDQVKAGGPSEDARKAYCLILEEPDLLVAESARKALKAALELSAIPFTKWTRQVREDIAATKKKSGGPERDPQGRAVLVYEQQIDDHDLVGFCAAAVKEKNSKDKQPTISQKGGVPVAMKVDPDDTSVKFAPMSYAGMKAELSELVVTKQRGEKGVGPREFVSQAVAQHICERAESILPPAPEIMYSPFYTKDGTLLETSGFHEKENVLLSLGDLKVSPVKKKVTKTDMEVSRDWLRENIFSDFPFLEIDKDNKKTRKPGEANAFAMCITPFVRRMVSGQTPLFFITKNDPGTGATLLATIPLMLLYGTMAIVSIRHTSNSEEMEKKVIAYLLGGTLYLFFDNVREFNNEYLLQSLTSPTVSGRILGISKIVVVPNSLHWVATGIDAALGDEMWRRVAPIRLNAEVPKEEIKERPFLHPDMEQYVTKNRGLAIHHILTMVAYWISEGSVKFTDRTLPSFEDWAAKVGGILKACEIEGFLDTAPPVALDGGGAALTDFMRKWLALHGDNELKSNDLFAYALQLSHRILKGKGEDDKREYFDKVTIPSFENRVFKITNDKEAQRYQVRTKAADDGPDFWIKKFEKLEDGKQDAS